MPKKPTIVSGKNVPNGKKSKNNGVYSPPNTHKLLDEVITLLQEISTDTNLKLKAENYPQYEMKMHDDPRFSTLTKGSYTLFRKIIDHEDISHFFDMIKVMEKDKSQIEKDNGKKASADFESILIKDHVTLKKK